MKARKLAIASLMVIGSMLVFSSCETTAPVEDMAEGLENQMDANLDTDGAGEPDGDSPGQN